MITATSRIGPKNRYSFVFLDIIAHHRFENSVTAFMLVNEREGQGMFANLSGWGRLHFHAVPRFRETALPRQIFFGCEKR